jgi:UDP-galactopyranose mutase
MYDYLVVGSGLYGAIFAHEAKKAGKSVLVVDKRPNIAGNIYTEKQEGINVHKYGAHIFHTNNKKVWEYITQFAEFNRFTNTPDIKCFTANTTTVDIANAIIILK